LSANTSGDGDAPDRPQHVSAAQPDPDLASVVTAWPDLPPSWRWSERPVDGPLDRPATAPRRSDRAVEFHGISRCGLRGFATQLLGATHFGEAQRISRSANRKTIPVDRPVR
jgi:hypothetical protein